MTSRQAAELDHAMERNDFTAAHAKKLSTGNVLRDVARVLDGTAEIVVQKNTVDLGKKPSLPVAFDGAEVDKHEGKGVVEIELRSDDNLYVDGKKVVLYLSELQMGDKVFVGYELRKELENDERVFLNSNVLDYLYEHPELFPKHWKEDKEGNVCFICFWGSIFCNLARGHLYVGCLYWGYGKLNKDYLGLDYKWFRQQFPSASITSKF